jgi:ATP-dependent Clp protease ATP-binding subunit ClpC
MYPFERFTERAKKVLTLAQQEAERAHHSYIGTEHLLLGLLREQEGLAAKALTNLGVELDATRQSIEQVLQRGERIIIQQIVPTSRVKKVIEISFEEAKRMGHNYVGTEHLLLGLLVEGEGVAAHALKDMGATLGKVRAEIDRLLHGGVGEPPSGAADQPPPPRLKMEADPALASLLESAQDAAQKEGARELRADHLLGAMLGEQSPVLGLLKSAGVDVDALRAKLQGPE